MENHKRLCDIYYIKEPVEYRDILLFQERLVNLKIQGKSKSDFLIILEHTPVFTIGKNGDRKNLLVSHEVLAKNNISVFNIQRGGDITYHGPGQIVAYPIFNIKSPRIAIKEFVYLLEEVMIRSAKKLGIHLERNELNRGVWCDNKKIGSVGIAIKKGITYHGIALNINVDITPFSWINPCGLKNIEVSTLEMISKKHIEVDKVKKILMKEFIDIFNLKEFLKKSEIP